MHRLTSLHLRTCLGLVINLLLIIYFHILILNICLSIYLEETGSMVIRNYLHNYCKAFKNAITLPLINAAESRGVITAGLEQSCQPVRQLAVKSPWPLPLAPGRPRSPRSVHRVSLCRRRTIKPTLVVSVIGRQTIWSTVPLGCSLALLNRLLIMFFKYRLYDYELRVLFPCTGCGKHTLVQIIIVL